MLIKSIPFWILVIFGCVGALIVGNFFHEYSHFKDYEKFTKYEEEFCVLNYNTSLSGSLGYYAFTYNLNETAQITQASKYSEIKAYFLTIVVYSIFLFSLNKLLFDSNENI